MFLMIDMKPISFYIGLKVERDRTNQTIKLFQPTYIDKMLVRFHLNKANVINTPIKKMSLLQARIDDKATAVEKKRYQGMTGLIMFSIVEIRPDIVFATLVVNSFAKNSGNQYIKVVKTIL